MNPPIRRVNALSMGLSFLMRSSSRGVSRSKIASLILYVEYGPATTLRASLLLKEINCHNSRDTQHIEEIVVAQAVGFRRVDGGHGNKTDLHSRSTGFDQDFCFQFVPAALQLIQHARQKCC